MGPGTDAGAVILVTAHIKADSVAVLRENGRGLFEFGDDGSPFPMKITMSMPQLGHLSLLMVTARRARRRSSATAPRCLQASP